MLRHLGLAALLLAAGCSAKRAPFDDYTLSYNTTLERAAREQLLLNLVRLRYGETALFLQPGDLTVALTYRFEAGVEAAVSATTEARGVTGGPLRLRGERGASPTLTLTPLQGEAFAEAFLTPIGAEHLALLLQSGWRADLVLRVLLERLGNYYNVPTPRVALPPSTGDLLADCRALEAVDDQGELDFHRMACLLTVLQRAGLLDAGVARTHGAALGHGPLPAAAFGGDLQALAALDATGHAIRLGDDAVCLYPPGPPLLLLDVVDRRAIPEGLPAVEELFGAVGHETVALRLGLGPGTRPEVPGCPAIDGDDAARALPTSSRSLADALSYLSQGIPVPERDRDRVSTSEGWAGSTEQLLRVETGARPPPDAYVAVRHDGDWFWVPGDDHASRHTFAFLLTVLALLSADLPEMSRILTIPAIR